MEPTNTELQEQIDHLSRQLDEMQWPILDRMNGADIEAIAFLVLMAASKSAQEDLKAIMAHVKAINAAKQKLRQHVALIAIDALSDKRSKLDECRIKMLLSWLLT